MKLTIVFLGFILCTFPADARGKRETAVLSDEAQRIMADTIAHAEELLNDMPNNPIVVPEELTRLRDINFYINAELQKIGDGIAPSYDALKARAEDLSDRDEGTLVAIYIERQILSISQGLITPEEYIALSGQLEDLIDLSNGSLRYNSYVYSLMGDTYINMAFYEKGAAFVSKGMKSMKAYEEGYRLDDANYEALLGIGIGHIYTPVIGGGDIRIAFKALETIVDESPDDLNRYFGYAFLGVAHEREGDRESAMENWNRAESMFPGGFASSFLRAVGNGHDPLAFVGL